jgi:hypothetical protein
MPKIEVRNINVHADVDLRRGERTSGEGFVLEKVGTDVFI